MHAPLVTASIFGCIAFGAMFAIHVVLIWMDPHERPSSQEILWGLTLRELESALLTATAAGLGGFVATYAVIHFFRAIGF